MVECLTIKNENWIKRVGCSEIFFLKRVTLLVGPNGSGKSSVLKLISGLTAKSKLKAFLDLASLKYKSENGIEVLHLDTENTLRTQSFFGDNVEVQMAMKFVSHGEAMKVYYKELKAVGEKEKLYCIDEPENGLDIKEQQRLAALIKNTPHQYIIATHSPILWAIDGASLVVLGDDERFIEDCRGIIHSSVW